MKNSVLGIAKFFGSLIFLLLVAAFIFPANGDGKVDVPFGYVIFSLCVSVGIASLNGRHKAEESTDWLATPHIESSYNINIQRKRALGGSAKSYKVLLDSNYVGDLKNGKTLSVPASAGKHTLSFVAFFKTEKEVSIIIQPGQFSINVFARVNQLNGKIELSMPGVELYDSSLKKESNNIALKPVVEEAHPAPRIFCSGSPIKKVPENPIIKINDEEIIQAEKNWRREQMGLKPIEYELDQIDHMDGHAFEYWCANLLRENGYCDVEVTSGSGDQGVDIIATKNGVRYAIQCKCYSSDLGNKPIQEVNAGKAIYKCHVGVVMTNRYFTDGAQSAAEATGTILWDRDKIIEMLEMENQ